MDQDSNGSFYTYHRRKALEDDKYFFLAPPLSIMC